MTIDSLFVVQSGVATSALEILSGPTDNAIPFLRPAKSQERTISGWIDRDSLPASQIFPAGSLFVSTNGEGSHTYAYVSSFEFACNSDVSVLTPRSKMTIQEKIFYARCITLNRFRFSYGRKPKGRRLKSIRLPDFPKEWAKIKISQQISSLKSIQGRSGPVPVTRRTQIDQGLVTLETLFEIRYGHGLDLVGLQRTGDEGTRFVSRTKRNNGVSAYVKLIAGTKPYDGGALTCALNGEGGVLYTFLQDEPFYTAYHVAALRPKAPMTTEELLFYCSCIRANRFRYSYGRQANRTLKLIRVPRRVSIPKWVYGALSRVPVGIPEGFAV